MKSGSTQSSESMKETNKPLSPGSTEKIRSNPSLRAEDNPPFYLVDYPNTAVLYGIFVAHKRGTVSGAIIHEPHPNVLVSLCQDRVDALSEVVSHVVDGYDDVYKFREIAHGNQIISKRVIGRELSDTA